MSKKLRIMNLHKFFLPDHAINNIINATKLELGCAILKKKNKSN